MADLRDSTPDLDKQIQKKNGISTVGGLLSRRKKGKQDYGREKVVLDDNAKLSIDGEPIEKGPPPVSLLQLFRYAWR